MSFTLERWDEHEREWRSEGRFATKAEARARAFELRLMHFRVREA